MSKSISYGKQRAKQPADMCRKGNKLALLGKRVAQDFKKNKLGV